MLSMFVPCVVFYSLPIFCVDCIPFHFLIHYILSLLIQVHCTYLTYFTLLYGHSWASGCL